MHVETVEEEVDRLLETRAIREINYPTWLSNTVEEEMIIKEQGIIGSQRGELLYHYLGNNFKKGRGSKTMQETETKARIWKYNKKNKKRKIRVKKMTKLKNKAKCTGTKYTDLIVGVPPGGRTTAGAFSFCYRSYLEMEKQLNVFVYEEGDPPVFHYGPCKHTYAIEGLFIQSIEISKFRTRDPERAHLYFLPFSVTMITQVVYVVDSHDWGPMKNTAKDYVDVIANKYPYWNRSLGADHFMLACHDWGPEISFAVPNLYNNSIRALCNANTSEKLNPSRDVSIPEICLPSGTTTGPFSFTTGNTTKTHQSKSTNTSPKTLHILP
ncbi:hypothetical protein HYC85_018134 [Camellia sinensis]|uniref:Exostosin GT47 domain-containing protein n=1 Tax=Camellia sinensis TaxID=4442 RepID=A0A7J7GUC8_CAMSI|nr:hypothetical protein HYC85_018134 [Camellia sinensis]